MNIMSVAYHNAICDENICHEGRRAQEDPPGRIDVGSLLRAIISSLDAYLLDGERGCYDEIHHDNQSTQDETASAFI